MPGFKDSLSDGQIAELVSWLRRQFAPDKPPWTGVPEAVGRARHAESDRSAACKPLVAEPPAR